MRKRWQGELIVLSLAAAIFLGSVSAPPHLFDDVDASFAQIGRVMLQSGDWVTPRLDGVRDMEKPPLLFWLMGLSYRVFGVNDWAARIPLALGAVILCWLTVRFGSWAFGLKGGFYAGLVLVSSLGLYLFTRILFLDGLLTVAITASLYCFVRTLEPDEKRHRQWALGLGAALGVGLLAKGLIALALPIGAGVAYLIFTRQLDLQYLRTRLHPLLTVTVMLIIAAPWHIVAAIRNPPLFTFTLHSGPGQYHGFLWFYFINEQILRFLNLRYPRDYSTVPRSYFWLLNLLWMFPWSVYAPAVTRLRFSPMDRAGRIRLLCLCWAGFLLVFFTFSTTQEYYSMSCYPAFALLLGSALDAGGVWVRRATQFLTVLLGSALLALLIIFFAVRNLPATGDISAVLQQHPEDYYLSLGHFHDLTLASFAYLRAPLLLAGAALAVGIVGALWGGKRTVFALVLMVAVFEFAARRAMTVFDPYLSSEPLAEAITKSLDGEIIIDGEYYPFSSIFFYSNRSALLLNGRQNDLEYGSYAPDAPRVYIDDEDFVRLWQSSGRFYFVTDGTSVTRLRKVAGLSTFHHVTTIGGKSLFTNH